MMKSIKYAFWGGLAVLTLLWMLADTFYPQPFGYFTLRHVLVQYSGVMAMGCMSVIMLLALRPVWLEPVLGGLDKTYRLHKWAGIAALVFATLHWWWAKVTKWMVEWGWLVKPAKGAGPEYTGIEAVFRTQRGLAETLGEWTFYIAVILIILALVKRFPYHLFAKTHKILAVAYLVLVFHSVILMEFVYWLQPVGIVMAVLMAVGTVSAVIVLCNRIGAGRKTQGRIRDLVYYPELNTLETTIHMDNGWAGHKPGQFAFLTTDYNEGAHPYTIASAWNPMTGDITFITKALGDYTARMHDQLKVGDPVTLEGPYGCFTFGGNHKRQIWIGAGIGITPFIARMKQLAEHPNPQQQVDLFHPSAQYSELAFTELAQDADASGVKLHVLLDQRDGRLDGQRLRETVPDWKEASIWFCGPAGFGQALRDDLVSHGMNPKNFHQELFQMR